MPYASVFPVSQLFTSPLAVTMTFNGTSYKCIYEKEDASDDLNGENYRITAEVQASTAVLISDGDTVTINSIFYKVAYRSETNIGTVILYLSQADMVTPEVSVGSELIADTNFSTNAWIKQGAVVSTGSASFADSDDYITYTTSINLTVGAVYRLRITASEYDGAVLKILEETSHALMEIISLEATSDIYFTAYYPSLTNIKFQPVPVSDPLTITSVSLKEVL